MAVEGVRGDETIGDVLYSDYHDETELPRIMELVQRDLSEPYSIFTYRYFIQGWPSLCHLVRKEKTRETAECLAKTCFAVVSVNGLRLS